MDLRYRTKEILRALDARQEITLTHRGTEKGKIIPTEAKPRANGSLLRHPAVGMWADALAMLDGVAGLEAAVLRAQANRGLGEVARALDLLREASNDAAESDPAYA